MRNKAAFDPSGVHMVLMVALSLTREPHVWVLMYAISDKCGLTHVIFLFVLNKVAYHPFTGVDMVSDEIPIVSVFCACCVHVIFRTLRKAYRPSQVLTWYLMK